MEEESVKSYLKGYEEYTGKQISRLTHMEKFAYDIIESASTGQAIVKEEYILFDYKNRNPLDHAACTHIFEKRNETELYYIGNKEKALL